MLIITGVLLGIIGITIVFFNLPYSKTKTEFMAISAELISRTDYENGVFTEEDIADLPLPVQKYFRSCGFIGTPKMSSMRAMFQDVDFILGKDKSAIKIDYTQYDFVPGANRIAYIDSSMYGIPFEGLDAYVAGAGSMKGVLAKLFTLFDQTGNALDKASLVTCLSESLLIPNMALQEYIVWEEIDALHAKAAITNYGITAGGIFTFNENGEMLSFTTDDREATATDGTSEKVKWTAVCSNYVETNGIKKPTVLKAIWHYDDGDLVYFDGKDVVIEFDTRE
jgi:L-rhamnose mutarotase